MPDSKISQLTAVDSLAGSEALPVVQSGVNKRATPAQIKTYIAPAAPTGQGQNDGLMSHADKAKLDGIESGATADQTAQEIATLINADATAQTTLKGALSLGDAAYCDIGTDPGEVAAGDHTHSYALDDLSDVATTGATDGQALVYDVEAQSWGPGTVANSGHARRYAFAEPYIYLGTAPAGTAESDTTWTLTRLTVDAEGVVTATESATDAWDNRVTATYS